MQRGTGCWHPTPPATWWETAPCGAGLERGAQHPDGRRDVGLGDARAARGRRAPSARQVGRAALPPAANTSNQLGPDRVLAGKAMTQTQCRAGWARCCCLAPSTGQQWRTLLPGSSPQQPPAAPSRARCCDGGGCYAGGTRFPDFQFSPADRTWPSLPGGGEARGAAGFTSPLAGGSRAGWGEGKGCACRGRDPTPDLPKRPDQAAPSD